MPTHDPSQRARWARTAIHVAWVTGICTILLGLALLVNARRLAGGNEVPRLHLVNADALVPLKTGLRNTPNDPALKQQIRELDQRLRQEYFLRARFDRLATAVMIGLALATIASLHVARHLRPAATPNLLVPPPPREPIRQLSARAFTGACWVLAGLGLALTWGHSPRRAQQVATTAAPAIADSDAANGPPAGYPNSSEIASEWPYFRGPDGSGIIPNGQVPAMPPVIQWQTAIDLPGESSPIRWGKRIFLTGANTKQRALYCFDADSGKPIWKQTVGTPQSNAAEAPEVMDDTGYAAPTPATDGRRVFAIFANGDVAGFTIDGKSLWTRSLGAPENAYGHAASLLIWHDRLIVVYDQGSDPETGKSAIFAMDVNSGKDLWRTPRAVKNSWVSPILINHLGREQIITAADPWVIAYDPANGKELWKANCMSGDVAPSPVYANGMVYVACDQSEVVAIRPDGSGDVTASHIVWKQRDAGLPDLCSLLCDGPRLYTLVFGIFHAMDAHTGKPLWEHDMTAKFEASPTLIQDQILLLGSDGTLILGQAGAKGFKETARAELGEAVGASPAFSQGNIYIRGHQHLFCIREQAR